MDTRKNPGSNEGEFVFDYEGEESELALDDDKVPGAGQTEGVPAGGERKAPPVKKLVPIALLSSALILVGAVWFVAPDMLPGAELVSGLMGSEEVTEDAAVVEEPAAEPVAQPPTAKPAKRRPAVPPQTAQAPRDPNAGESSKTGAQAAKLGNKPTKASPVSKSAKGSDRAATAARQAAPERTVVPAGAQKPQSATVVQFAPGSKWVAAREVEKLWSFSTGLGKQGAVLQIEAVPGAERGGVQLAQERAERVASMLRRNNQNRALQVTVRIGAADTRGGPRVVVSSLRKL